MSEILSKRRNRSRSLVGFASKGICETIPNSFTPSERLSMLLEHVFLYSLSLVGKELMVTEDLDLSIFRQKGMECWEKMKSTIQEKNLINLAVDENMRHEDSFKHSNAEQYEGIMSKLQAEIAQWRNKISFYREGLRSKIDERCVSNASELTDYYQLYDYSDIAESASSIQKKLALKIENLSSVKTAFKGCLQLNKSLKRKMILRCEKYLKRRKLHSPRALIRKIARTKRTVAL